MDTRRRPIRRTLLALLALVAFAGVLLALSSGPAEAETFTVNRTGDAGDRNLADTVCDASSKSGNQCTLRAAIQEANDTPGADTINFNIGGRATVKTINVGSTGLGALPIITDAVTINGYTQRRAKENTLAEGNDAVLKVQLNGANAGTNANGLEIQAADSTIKGLVINRFSAHGILISGSGATGNHVEGTFIGTNAKGTKALGNSLSGVRISLDAENNTIGGTQPAQRNVISGNTGGSVGAPAAAVEIRSSPTGNQGNQVLGNFIGTTADGTGDLGNGTDGVRILDAPNNTIGGTDADDGAVDGVVKARNIISGNGGNGVVVSRGSPETGSGTGNRVEGNYIGTDVSGTQALGNHTGVFIAGWSDNTVGGTAAGAGNTISGNDNSGVFFFSGEFNKVEGNRIGLKADGTEALPNGRDGVILSGSGNTVGGTDDGARNIISGNGTNGVKIFGTDHQVLGNFIGTDASGTQDLGNILNGVDIQDAENNTVGGTTSEARNVISGNGGDGVGVFGGTGNSVLSNQIFANTGLGIDLGPDGVEANDNKDLDTGANNLQNFPVITSAIRSNTTTFTTISGTIHSNTNQSFTVQCFVAAPDPSLHGEGQIPAGQDTTVTTNANGDGSFSCNSRVPQAGQAVTATATNTSGTATGDTSEFSRNVGVVAVP